LREGGGRGGGSHKGTTYERVFTLFLIKANLEGPISVNPIWHGVEGGGRDPTPLLLCRKSGVII